MSMEFRGLIWYWRGPAPHYFVTVPPDECTVLREVSRLTTYGWGMIPVEVTIGTLRWETSLFPKDGGYALPLKAAVRRAEGVELGDEIVASMTVLGAPPGA